MNASHPKEAEHGLKCRFPHSAALKNRLEYDTLDGQ